MPLTHADAAQALARLDAQSPEAGQLLRLLAFLAPQPVPLAMIAEGADLLPEPLAAAMADASRRSASVAAPRDAGVAMVEEDEIDVEPEARRVVLDGLGGEERKTWAAAAAEVALRSYPKEPEKAEYADACARLLPHAVAAADAAAAAEAALNRAASLLGLAGRFELARERLPEARRLLERTLPIRERAHGPMYPLIAWDLTYLNGTLSRETERERLVENAQRALEILEAERGERDHTVIVHINNVGTLRRLAGHSDHARPYFQRAQALAEEVYGPVHPFFATISSNLGDTLQEAGDLAAARREYERALHADETHYGTDNRSVIRDAQKLARLLVRLGEPNAARPLLQRTLAFWEKEAGAAHPHVAAIREEIASLGADR